MRKVDEIILRALQVPESEQLAILEAVGTETEMPAVSKKGVAAWSLLCVYDESPAFVLGGVFGLFIVLPFFIIFNLVSGG